MTMNPSPDHLDDEILSALLDGDAADGPEAAAHLAACERCAGRRAELAAARVALAAAPVEPLDELTRRRLVAGALRAAGEAAIPAAAGTRSRWAARHPAVMGSAAAVVLAVLVGVPFVMGRGGGSQAEKTLSAAAPEAAHQGAGEFYGDLGDLSDHDRLRLRLSGSTADASLPYAAPAEPGASPAAGAPVAAPMPSAAPVSGGLAGTSGGARSASPSTTLGSRGGVGAGSSNAAKSAAGPGAPPTETATAADSFASNESASNQSAGRDRADTDSCVATLLAGPAKGGRLTGSGTGTYHGRPAIMAAFELSGSRVAFVADRAGCGVLDRFSY
jgi:hypothetical protein